MSNKRYSKEEKYKILLAYEKGEFSLNEISSKYHVNWSSIKDWKRKFEQYGIQGLEKSEGWKGYSKDLKLMAIKDHLSGNYSLREVVQKYDISSTSVLRKWIKHYNGHKELTGTSKGRANFMTKGRKTTWEERKQIVFYYLENGKSYQKAAEIYEVSYQQVYQWVKKYVDGGEEALRDNRGKIKVEAELSPEEKIKLEMKRIEKENERLRAENAFLKKLEELERRRD